VDFFSQVVLAISVRASHRAACPHTGFLHFGASDCQTAQSLCSLGFGLTTTPTTLPLQPSLGIKQTTKVPAYAFEAVHALNLASG
jgi:hypothetical protein